MANNFTKISNGLNLDPISSDPLNPTEGDIQVSDGTVRAKGLWIYKDGAWEGAGGGGGGGLDTFYTQDFESYDFSNFTSGLNATYKTAGTFGGVLSSETTNPISKDSSPKYTAGVTSTNDWFDIQTIDLDLKQRDSDIGITLWADMTGFSVDAEIVIWDVTNGKKLDTTGLHILEAETGLSRYSLSVYIPATTLQISYGFHMVTAPVNGESFIFDDIELSTNPFVYKDLIEVNSVNLKNNDGRVITVTTEDIHFAGSGVGWTSTGDTHFYTPLKNSSVITFSGCVATTANIVTAVDLYKNGTLYKRLSGIAATNNYTTFDYSSTKGEFSTSDDLSFRLANAGGTLSVQDTGHYLAIAEQSTSENVITPFDSSVTVENLLTADQSVAGDLTDLTFSGLIIGRRYLITGQMYMNLDTGITQEVWFRSAASNGGTIYGNLTNIRISASGDAMEHVSIIFTAVSETMYAYQAAPRTIYGDGTKTETFLQLTNLNTNGLVATPTQKVAYIKDAKASGTAGGTFTSGAWQTRDLNTLSGDIGFVSVSSNQFTLQPGKYKIDASAPAYLCNLHKLKLYNITDSSDAIIGSSEYADVTNLVQNSSFLEDEINISVPTIFEIQHRCSSTQASTGLGNTATFGVDEIYTQVKLTKLR